VVARAHRDHAARLLGVAQLRELVARSPFLERGGELEVLEFQENLRAGYLRQRPRLHDVPVHDLAGGAGFAGPHVCDGNHGWRLSA